MAESIADKILDFIGKISLVKPEKPLSEMVPGKEQKPEESLTNYRDFPEKKEQLTRGSAEGIWDTITNWFGKSAPYTRARKGSGMGSPGLYTNKPGYKF